MSERDYGKEIDELKKSVAEILSVVKKVSADKEIRKDKVVIHLGHKPDKDENPVIHTEHKMSIEHDGKMHIFHHTDNRLSELANEFTTFHKDVEGGRVTSVGTYSSGGRQSSWISEHKNADELFTIIDDGTAEKVLKCIGSTSRLRLLLTILKKPMRVNQLVEECGYSSTGQIYHHLQPLINADLVTESSDDRGAYIIQPHRVQGIIMILSGISDLIDKKYTEGDWEWEK